MQCKTCGEQGKEGLSLLEPENANLLQFIIIHLQKELAGGSFFVCHACVVEIQHWRNFLTRFQASQTHFHQVLATSDILQQTTDVSLETILPKCQVLVTKLLQCDSCSFYTNNKTQLESHMQTHLANTSVRTTLSTAKRHAANEGRISFQHQCSQCGIKFAYPEVLVWHTANFHGANILLKVVKVNQRHEYHCAFCKTVFSIQNVAIWHLFQKHKIRNLPFHCNFCEKQFMDITRMKNHQFKCKNRNYLSRAFYTFDHRCDECGLKYAHPEILKWHIENCHGSNAVVKIIETADNNKTKHQFQCILCQTIFNAINLILRHLRIHHNLMNSPFHCNYCEKTFVVIQELKEHELKCKNKKTVHCILGPTKHGFKCKHCNQLFRFQKQLLSHYRSNHPGESIIQCAICNKEFYSYHSYKIHSKYKHESHCFTCNICSASFNYPVSLQTHIKEVHSKETFACKFCSTRVKSKRYLQQHLREIHTGTLLYCSHCKYNTRRKMDLINHIRCIHTCHNS